jgi:hypothetical protein
MFLIPKCPHEAGWAPYRPNPLRKTSKAVLPRIELLTSMLVAKPLTTQPMGRCGNYLWG